VAVGEAVRELGEILGAPAAQASIADARRRRFERGEVVFHEGDPGDALHQVVTGHFGITTGTTEGDRIMLEIVGPGGVFGELAIFGADPYRTASVVALERGETRSLHRAAIDDLCRAVPDASAAFLRLLAERSVAHTTRLLEVVYVPAEVRVVRRIVDLAVAFPEGINLTQEQVGEMACTSRATVNKVLRTEEAAGVLELGRGMVTINDVDALRRRAERGGVPYRPPDG
jgi:CRP-like cAMP-binding protein